MQVQFKKTIINSIQKDKKGPRFPRHIAPARWFQNTFSRSKLEGRFFGFWRIRIFRADPTTSLDFTGNVPHLRDDEDKAQEEPGDPGGETERSHGSQL